MTQEISIVERKKRTTNITEGDEKAICFSVTDHHLLEACFRLRYRYFAQERGWVAPDECPGELERDAYDGQALHLAVFNNGDAVAYLRVLPHEAGQGFMLDREFAGLLSEAERHALSRAGAVELSRLVCRYDVSPLQSRHPVERLLRLLYRISVERGFSRFYIVVEESWLRPFVRRFRLPFHLIGSPHTFPDGTRTVAAMATLAELEAAMLRHSRAKYDWYQDSD